MRTDVSTFEAPRVVVDAAPCAPENSRQGVSGHFAEVISWVELSTAWSASGKPGYAYDFAAGAAYYPLADALGSVTAITDASGNVVRRYSYDVYGARTSTGAGPDIAFGFTGREHDASGLIYSRDRYMDPATGRFIQADRAGFVDGPNLYQYARGTPTLNVDPDGRLAMLLYGNPNRLNKDAPPGLKAVTRSGKILTNWMLSEQNWEGYRDASKKLISTRYGIPYSEIRAFPFWTSAHISTVESLTTRFDTIVYFGHGAASDRIIPNFIEWQKNGGGWLDAADLAGIILRNANVVPNRVILEGCFTQSLASSLQSTITASLVDSQVSVEGRSSSMSVVIKVEDQPPYMPYELSLEGL